jgi:hypothetical protein
MLAALCIGVFFVFMTGYFWGKKSVMEEFGATQQRESLADKIYSSLCVLPENRNNSLASNEESDEPSEENVDEPLALEESQKTSDGLITTPTSTIASTTNIQNQNIQKPAKNLPTEVVAPCNNTCYYYAKLVSFKSRKHAQQFVERLARLGIDVELHALKSKTAKGRVVTWYQIVTKKLASNEELEALVNTIKLQTPLHDVRICTC